MLALAISLGHNSSAVLIKDGKIICGYEEERLTGIKADSSYPDNAIRKCVENIDKDLDAVYISHWSTYGNMFDLNDKHFNKQLFSSIIGPKTKIFSHNEEFTHHDAHMEIARVYSGPKPVHTIVADGFGNFNEVLSIYENDKIIFRSHGYGKSLGLLYQYTTAFLGMKMNQDEYKLLGYEAHILDVISEYGLSINPLNREARKLGKKYFKELMNTNPGYKLDSLLDTSALIKTRVAVQNNWIRILRRLNLQDDKLKSTYDKRVIVSYILQQTVEYVLIKIINHFKIKSVNLVGGLFYNVKLNKTILDEVNEICVCPLAGDQGAGLGVYQKHNKDLVLDRLTIGDRSICYFPTNDTVYFVETDEEACEIIDKCLDLDLIINVFRGHMEFGPRALGNTSTIMRPSMQNVDYINQCNGRNTIMPCAPIVTDKQLFRDHNKVIRSLEHMIITLDYAIDISNDLRGAAHNHPINNVFTGRPQVIDESHYLFPIVKKYKILVNTSFNIHGQPIIYNTHQLRYAIDYQFTRDVLGRIRTVVVYN